ncbi:hypothetical protein BC826DRAFT_1081809, partial [Russula brevipes]
MHTCSRCCDPATLVLHAWVALPRSTCNTLFIVLLMSCGMQITLHLVFILPHPAVLQPTQVQATRTL